MGLLHSLRDVEEPLVRDRPIGLLVIAVASLLAGLAVLAAAGELLLGAARFGDWTRPKIVGNDAVGAVQVYPEHYLLVAAILLVPALVLVGVAVGIVRQRWWAGIVGLVVGAVMALYGLLALVIPTDASSGSERWHPAAALPWLILGVTLAWYFNRRSIRADLGMGDRTFG